MVFQKDLLVLRKAEVSSFFKSLLRWSGWLLVLHAVLVFIVFIGAEVERRHVILAPTTSGLYSTPLVCAAPTFSAEESVFTNSTMQQFHVFTTYQSHSEASSDNALIAHCGACGQCSTIHDMNVVKSTTKTLTKDSTRCATIGLLTGNQKLVSSCMESLVGFTSSCQKCWVDNIACSLSSCKFSCMKSLFILKEAANSDGKQLNPCLECDEKLCGPQFLKCAGANRRRLGVHSDIAREVSEVCTKIEMG